MNKVIKNFVEFWQAIKSIDYDSTSEILLFRGHSNKSYLLQPGIFRESIVKVDEEVNQYHNILIEYPEEFQKNSHLSNLVKMQHYGVSTRLLDFSTNPLVALFFASEVFGTEDNNYDAEVVVIKVKKSEILHHNSDRALMLSCIPCFKDKDKQELKHFCETHRGRITEQYVQNFDSVIHKFLHEIRGEYPGFECGIIGNDLLSGFFVSPFKDNERMKLQSGLFYIFGLDETPLDNKMECHRIVIDRHSKSSILEDLKLMNISNASLYSGLERAAFLRRDKSAKWSANK